MALPSKIKKRASLLFIIETGGLAFRSSFLYAFIHTTLVYAIHIVKEMKSTFAFYGLLTQVPRSTPHIDQIPLSILFTQAHRSTPHIDQSQSNIQMFAPPPCKAFKMYPTQVYL